MSIILPPEDTVQSHRLRSIQTLLENHRHLLSFLFLKDQSELNAAPSDLLCSAGFFSHGEIVLILIALDIWCGDGSVTLHEAFQVLDKSNWQQLVKALSILGKIHEL